MKIDKISLSSVHSYISWLIFVVREIYIRMCIYSGERDGERAFGTRQKGKDEPKSIIIKDVGTVFN